MTNKPTLVVKMIAEGIIVKGIVMNQSLKNTVLFGKKN